MNHRPRRPIIPIAGVVVAGLAVVAVIVYAVTSSGSPSSSHNASGNQPATTQSPPTTGHSRTSQSTTTPTTAPKSLVTVSATPAAGTYTVPGPTYTVTLTVTSGECWVQATSTDTGSALFTGLIAPGAPQVLHASGVTLLDIGAPHSLQVSVNGVPATYPAGFLTPFNMTLQPTA
jgi:RodZ C-terminal domain